MPNDLTIAQLALKRWRADSLRVLEDFARSFPEQMARGVEAEVMPPADAKEAATFVQALQSAQGPQEVEMLLQQRIAQVGIQAALREIQKG